MNLVIKAKDSIVVTEKEVEIVRMLSNGAKTAKISKELKIKIRTLESIIARLKAYSGCKTMAELACAFLRNKIIE